MAIRQTSATYSGSLLRETYRGSLDFEYLPFYPTIFSFDIDSDTLNIKDVELVSKGTPLISNSASVERRREYVGESFNSPHFGVTSDSYSIDYSLSLLPSGSTSQQTGDSLWSISIGPTRIYKYFLVNVYFGFGYSFERNQYVCILFTESSYSAPGTNPVAGEITYGWVSKGTTIEEYVRNTFFGGQSPEQVYRIERIKPASSVFIPGQSSVLEYALTNSAGEPISTEPSELSVYPGTGWGYNDETKILQYISGSWATNATVKFTYDGEVYQKNDTFYPEGRDIYIPGGTSGIMGGGGAYGKGEISDNILKDLPSGSVEADSSATGMYTRYLVNSSYLDIIGDWLWTTDAGLAIAKSVISLLYGDPAESVIGLMSFPFNLQSLHGMSTRSQNLFWGGHDTTIRAVAITSNAATIDWGTISLSEYWGNFLDYSPHTKIELYLPWGTGFVSIDPGQCLPGTLRVITNVELTKGSCIHNVIGNDGCIIGSFAGQCAKQLPLFSSDFASKVAGLVTAAAAGITVGAAGLVGAGAGAALGSKIGITTNNGNFVPQRGAIVEEAASQAVSNMAQTGRVAGRIATTSLAVNKAPTHITRNGGFTDGSAALGIQFPYIILSRPTQSVPKEYGHHYGYPSNIYSSLSSLRGYTEIGEIHLDGVPGSADELSELDRILKEGVIF